MKGKLTLLTGAAIGYVVGTAAGRQRYEQLKAQARRAMDNPKVHEAASEMQQKAAGAASKVTHAATSRMGRGSEEAQEPAFTSSTPNGYPPE